MQLLHLDVLTSVCYVSYITSLQGRPQLSMCRVGRNRIYTPYMTVYLVISLPKTPHIHRIYMVLANPKYVCTLTRVYCCVQPCKGEFFVVNSNRTNNCTYIYIHIHIHICMSVILVYLKGRRSCYTACVCWIVVCEDVSTHTQTHKHSNTNTHTCMHARTHTHTNTQTHKT